MESSNKKALLLMVIIVAVVVTIFSLIRKSQYTPQPINKDVSTDKLRDLKAQIWDNYVSFIIEDDFKMLDQNVILGDTAGTLLKLKDLSPGKYKILVRYSSTDCDICVDSIMNIISGLTDKTSLDKIYAITDTRDERDFLIRSADKKYPIKVYRLAESSLGLFMENKNYPFLFVLTPDSRAVKIFIPTKEIPSQIKAYFSKALKFIDVENSK